MIPVNILNNYLNHLDKLCGRPEENLILAELDRYGLLPYIPSFPLPKDPSINSETAIPSDSIEDTGGYFYVIDGVLYIGRNNPVVIAQESCADVKYSEVY